MQLYALNLKSNSQDGIVEINLPTVIHGNHLRKKQCDVISVQPKMSPVLTEEKLHFQDCHMKCIAQNFVCVR